MGMNVFRRTKLGVVRAKKIVLESLKGGLTVKESTAKAGYKTEQIINYWCQADKSFELEYRKFVQRKERRSEERIKALKQRSIPLFEQGLDQNAVAKALGYDSYQIIGKWLKKDSEYKSKYEKAKLIASQLTTRKPQQLALEPIVDPKELVTEPLYIYTDGEPVGEYDYFFYNQYKIRTKDGVDFEYNGKPFRGVKGRPLADVRHHYSELKRRNELKPTNLPFVRPKGKQFGFVEPQKTLEQIADKTKEFFNEKHVEQITANRRPLTIRDVENSEPYKVLEQENEALKAKVKELEAIIEENVDNSYRWNDKVKQLTSENERLQREVNYVNEDYDKVKQSAGKLNELVDRNHDLEKDLFGLLGFIQELKENISTQKKWIKGFVFGYGLAGLIVLYGILSEVLK